MSAASSRSSHSAMDVYEEIEGLRSPTHLPDSEFNVLEMPAFTNPSRMIESGEFPEKINCDHRPLTFGDFSYTMDILNKKFESMYEFCRFFGEQQKEIGKNLQKLVYMDTLSDGFWKVCNFI